MWMKGKEWVLEDDVKIVCRKFFINLVNIYWELLDV